MVTPPVDQTCEMPMGIPTIDGHFRHRFIGGTDSIFLGLCKGIYRQNVAKNMVQYPHLLDPGMTIDTTPEFWWDQIHVPNPIPDTMT